MNTYNFESIGPYAINGPVLPTSGQVRAIAYSSDIDGAGTGALFIGTRGGLWRSTDFAAPMPSWTSLTDGRADLQVIRSIVVDQADPRTLYVASRFALFRSPDAGVT